MTIIPYSAWGRRGQGGATIGPVSLIVVHHFYRPHISRQASRAREGEALRSVESYHTDTKGWGPGTGYQFHAFASGRAYEGRGWRRSGAHTVGKNGTSVAIALPIDGDAHEPTDAQTKAVADIIRQGLAAGHITPGYRVRGHRDYSSKSCPGTQVSDAWLRSFEDLDQPDDMEDVMAQFGPPLQIVKDEQGRWFLYFRWREEYAYIATRDALSRLTDRAEKDDRYAETRTDWQSSWFQGAEQVADRN